MVAPMVAVGARTVARREARASAVNASRAALQTTGTERKQRISFITAFFMIGLALIFDLIQFFLNLLVFFALGSVYITFLAASIFAIWFLLLGVSYFNGRNAGTKMLAAVGGVIAELVPLINALPATTASVITIILITRLEDRAP